VQAINVAVADGGGGADEPAEVQQQPPVHPAPLEAVLNADQLQCIMDDDEFAPLLVNVDTNVDREVWEADQQGIQVNRETLRNQRMIRMIHFLQSRIGAGAPIYAAALTTTCTTVVMLGYMHEGHPKDQPVQRMDQNMEFDVAVHQGFWGVLTSLLAALVLVLGVCIEEGRSSAMSKKGDAIGLQNRRKLKWKDLPEEQPAVVAAALTAVLAKMAGPSAAKVFQVPQVPDKQADENARKAFDAGVLEATLASMEKHASEHAVLAPACGVLWAINASPEAADIRVNTALVESRGSLRPSTASALTPLSPRPCSARLATSCITTTKIRTPSLLREGSSVSLRCSSATGNTLASRRARSTCCANWQTPGPPQRPASGEMSRLRMPARRRGFGTVVGGLRIGRLRTKMVLAWRVLRSIWRRRELGPRPLTQRGMLEVLGESPKGVRKTIQSCLDFWQRGPLGNKDVVDTVRPFARRSMARMPTRRVALGVEAPVRAAMARPDATNYTKKYGKRLLNRLRAGRRPEEAARRRRHPASQEVQRGQGTLPCHARHGGQK
jgi:hypothetical protein